MSEADRIIGSLQKGVQGLEVSVAEVRDDVKKLLAQHNRNRGMTYTISAIMGGLTSLFIGLLR